MSHLIAGIDARRLMPALLMAVTLGGGSESTAVCAEESAAARPVPDAVGPDFPALDPPMRDLWSRGDTRVLRQWLLLGPVPGTLEVDELAANGGEASVHPAPGDAGSTTRWVLQPWGQEPTVMSGVPRSLQQYRGSAAAPEVGYAFHMLQRESEGDALISLGSDTGVRVWVNGALVHSRTTSDGFVFDRDRIPVHLNRGENRLLLKFEHHSGPWRFAVRVLEPGTIVADRDEVIPQVALTPAGLLTVRALSAHPSQSARARVQILVAAAGGRTVARAAAARDQTVQFPTAAWPDGAYEVHFTTHTVWGRTVTVHAPWYKGDALAAARRLSAAAGSAPADALGGTLRMLAALVREKLGGNLDRMPDDGWLLIHEPLLEYEELQQGTGPGRGPIHPGGFVRLAYLDETDGSTQFCRAYLPAHYDATRRWPLVLALHGYGPGNPPYVGWWWSVDKRHDDIAERRDVIFVEPHGRGNAQYKGIGEQDVLRCLEEAKRRFSVDEDRVHLLGESMGGEGVWLIASRHPELFAAAAPVYGGLDFRVLHDPALDKPHAANLPERFWSEVQSSFRGAEALLDMPLYIHHGEEDKTVSVENSRHAARMLQRWGYDVRYREYPGRGHEELDNRDEIVEWCLTHRRVKTPPRVRIRATDLDGASAYWVRVTSWETPVDVIRLDAEAIEPGLIRLDTHNVAAVTLSPPLEMRDGSRPIRVVWNGKERVAPLSATGTATLTSGNDQAAPLEKRPGLQGGLSDLIATPFAIVVGTSSADPDMNRLCREKAATVANLWEQWQHEKPRVFTDQQLTAQDEAHYSLLLVGGADANLITRRVQPRLPLLVERDGITIDGRRFESSDAVVQMIYPSPLNPQRYVLVVAATSAAGMHFWNAGGLWNTPGGPPRMDWTIRDGRLAKLERGLGPERTWVASGIFDRHWHRDDRWVFPGDAELRAKSPLRRFAPPGFKVAAGVLDSYVGRYELQPGFELSITRADAGLIIQIPAAGVRSSLTAESEDTFADDDTDGAGTFQRDAQGTVTGFEYIGEIGDIVAKKVAQVPPLKTVGPASISE